MARIRCIKPEFPHSESMGRVSRDARLTFIELWTLADDAGRLRGNSRMLASLLFPYDDDAKDLIDGWLSELEDENCVVRYAIDGTSYLQICNWLNHQKIDKPSPSKLPQFVEGSRMLSNPREKSSEDWKGLEGIGVEGKGPTTAAKRPTDEPPEFAEFKSIYPPRSGGNPWAKALKAIRARLTEGHTWAEILAGARRYAEYVRVTGKTSTEYVKQAATFCGPDKHFLEFWKPPPSKAQVQQDANVDAGLEWLGKSENGNAIQ